MKNGKHNIIFASLFYAKCISACFKNKLLAQINSVGINIIVSTM